MFDYKTLQQGTWEARTLIRDKKQNSSYIVNISVYSIKNEKLRVDLLDTFGNYMGSFLLVGDQLTVVDPKNRVAYKGKVNRYTLEKIISVPMDPRVFYTFLFEQPPAKALWKCEYKEEMISSCKNSRSRLNFTISNRVGAKKNIKFEYPNGYLQMNLKDFSSSISDPEKKFNLKIPSKFKIRKI